MNIGDKFKLPKEVSDQNTIYILKEIKEIPEDKYGNKFVIKYIMEDPLITVFGNTINYPAFRFMKNMDLISIV